MSKGIFYLVYTSIASKLMSDQELLILLDQSRNNNIVIGLTGMLLYMEGKFITKTQGRFIQVLEGEQDQVLNVFKSISKDERNVSVLMLGSGFNSHRNYPTWAMGFRSLDVGHYKNVDGFYDLRDWIDAVKSKQDANGIEDFLLSFYLINTEH